MFTVPPPLYLPRENAINPAFFGAVLTAVEGVLGLWVGYQLAQILAARRYGLHQIEYRFGRWSAGAAQRVRLAAVVVRAAAMVALAAACPPQRAPLILGAAVLVAVVLPLHAVEPTRLAVPLASLLFFWLALVLADAAALVQDVTSLHPLFLGTRLGVVLDATLATTSVAALVAETYFWRPTAELRQYYDLNEWRLDAAKNTFEWLSFSWVQPMISRVYRTDALVYDDLAPPPPYVAAAATLQALQRLWDRHYRAHGSGANLFWPVVATFKWWIAAIFAADLVDIALTFSQPFLLQHFIRFFIAAGSGAAAPPPPMIVGYFVATLMYVNSVLRFLNVNQLYMSLFSLSYCYQSGLTTMVYNKALRLTPAARKEKSAGDIVNNVTMDVRTIQWFCAQLQDFVLTPLKLALCIVLLHKIIGNATYGGLAACAVMIPVLSLVSASFMGLYPLLMKQKDARTSLITEMLNLIKLIKLYLWEKPMMARLREIRNNQELKTLKKIGIFLAMATFVWKCIPFFVSCASYATFVVIYDVPLTPDIVFPALLFFDMLTEPIFMLPGIITNLIEARTALKRLRDLLVMEEVNDCVKRQDAVMKGEVAVEIKDGTFVWSHNEHEGDEEAALDSPEVALADINFAAKKGQLTCVVGRVGSGKSTLFKALLGEVPAAGAADITICGSVAYCLQSPWILNGLVKQNILFGCRYNREWYNRTVDACELTTDFKVLPDGDRTVVGEKGISLSGGQKARVALARAVYSKSDVYLFDDVLSAVDAHVGKRITEKVLGPQGIIKTKTRVLATNLVPVLHEADLIYMLQKGRVVERGNFGEVMQRGGELASLIKEFGRKDHEEDAPSLHKVEVAPPPKLDVLSEGIAEFTGNEVALQRVISNETIGRSLLTSYSHVYVDEDDTKKTANEEESEKGQVKLAVFIEYFRACNVGWVSVYLLCTFVMMVLKVMEKVTLTRWLEANASAGATVRTSYFLTLYLLLGVAGGLLNLAASFVLWSLCIIRGARYFHDTMANSILRSPMRFFETTPIGRILNRFTDDIGTVDMQLPWIFMNFLTFFLNGVVTFAVICYNLPVMTFILAALLVVYNEIRKYFIPCLREIKRLESKSKSPLFAHIQELINGIDTVKAYRQSERFFHQNMQNIDKVVGLDYLSQACNRWLSIRLQTISLVLIYLLALLLLLSIGTDSELNPSLVGFVMNYALSIVFILNAIVRMWADVETQSVAVERLVEYCHLPPEAAEVVEANRPAPNWPLHGQIRFVNYSTRYADNLDNVLKNIDITINSNEKVGIVGRTGAGKSSLTLALFRIIEATLGHIEIDGVDTSKIGLADLRHQLSIIPQDAHTVEGSVRQNLDPFQQHSDDELWHALALAHLKAHVQTMKTEPSDKEREAAGTDLPTQHGLDAKIFEGGSNLLAGQKQLLCLARALLNPSKVLLLDEATAAVDVQTDKIIQETIRLEFRDKTILIIAHRLETIMDSDRVLVLDHGEVKEFDSPQALLDQKGIFYLLCKEGGYLPVN